MKRSFDTHALLLRAALGGAALGLLPTAATAGDGASAARPAAVVELFTSQGCANCPPADAFLGELAAEDDLVTLSYPVDYWDYLGWKDTAAKPEFTARQKAYAQRRGDHDVFTPQVVINGRARLVGSDRDGIRREIAEAEDIRHDLDVGVEVEAGRDVLRVRLPDSAASEPVHATIWLARFERQRVVAIGRGENSGRSIKYTHLVRSLQPIGMWKGKAVTIELPRPDGEADPNFGCAVLVQADRDGLPGRIVGARVCTITGI